MNYKRLPQARQVLESQFGTEFNELHVVGHGGWSSAFGFRHGYTEYILRLSKHEEDFHKDRYAMKFSSPHLPIPKVTTVGSTSDGFFAISERAYGRTIETMSEREMRDVLPSLFRSLDEMRTTDTSSTTGYGGWDSHGLGAAASWREYLLQEPPEARLVGWRAKLANNEGAQRAYDKGYALLGTQVDVCPELRSVIHADIHNNTLFENGRVSAIFDWGCALYGDFLYDLAWLTIWAPMFEATRGIDLRAEALKHYDALGVAVPNFEQRMLCYELSIGVDSLRYSAFIESDEIDITTNRLNEIIDGGITPTIGRSLC